MRRRKKPDWLGPIVALAILAAWWVQFNPEMRERLPVLLALAAGVAVIVGVIAAVVLIWWRRRTSETLLGSLAFSDRMKRLTWEEFERACAVLFERQGYRTSLTSTGADDGVDILLRKDKRTEIVQCKHYPDSYVGAPQVRELLGAKQDFGAEKAYLLTSGFFSKPAVDLAQRNEGLVLWDRDQIRSSANRLVASEVLGRKRSGGSGEAIGTDGEEVVEPEAAAAPDGLAGSTPEPAVAAEEDVAEATAPLMTCPRCAEQLIVRDGRYGKFIGCAGFPRCRYTRDVSDEEEAESQGLT